MSARRARAGGMAAALLFGCAWQLDAQSAFDHAAKAADAARSAGRRDEAAALYRKALALDPAWIPGHWALATLLHDAGQHAASREHFRYVIAADRQNGAAWAMAGLCDVRLKDYDTALADLEQALRLGVADDGLRAAVTLQTALLLNRAGNPQTAFEMLREFAGRGADTPPVIVAFGLALLRIQTMPEDVPAEQQPMVLLAGRGGYHMARGRRSSVGRLALEELVSRFPAQRNVHFALGAYLAPDEPEAAIEEFHKELRADPDHVASLLQLAALRTRLGNPAEALASAERAVRLEPEAPAGRLTFGRALLETGDTERALQELEKAAALAPASAEVQFALARAYQRAGRNEEAARARAEFQRLERAAKQRGGAS